MDQLVSWLNQSVAYLVPMIILLGLLIFVHELGHFLVAKYYKVRVEVFSLGFGPKLFKFKRGETTYAISAVPLGGYVKMFGDDPTADVPEEQKAVSFTHKPVGQRIAIVLAGPLMNFFFAILIFTVVAFMGEQVLAPRLGDIAATTPAFAAGFRSGDVVSKVSGEPVRSWENLQSRIEASGDQKVVFEVQRDGEAQPVTIEATPKLITNKNVLSWDSQIGEIEGLTYSSRSSVVGVSNPSSPVVQGGLKTGDIITAIDGAKVDKWRELTAEIGKHIGDGTIKLSFQRNPDGFDGASEKQPENLEVTVAVPETAKSLTGEEALNALGIEYPQTFLAGFDKKSPAKEAGLQVADKIVSIDGQKVQTFDEIAKIIRSYSAAMAAASAESASSQDAERKLQIQVERDGKTVDVAVTPHFKERMNNQGREEAKFEIGIKPMIIDAIPQTLQMSSTNPVEAVSRGFQQTMRWTSLTVLSFVRLFQAEVSAKNIGGFISIGQMAKKSWQIGASQFLNIMAIISINLFILNLLPVPVLDGGHLVFFGIEALRGAPLSMRKLEIAQQVGLILLLGLMVFALFNDVSRLFN